MAKRDTGLKGLDVLNSSRYSDDIPLKKTKKLNVFGISHKGNTTLMRWVVRHRKDMRHGVIGPTRPMSKYAKYLLESTTKGW